VLALGQQVAPVGGDLEAEGEQAVTSQSRLGQDVIPRLILGATRFAVAEQGEDSEGEFGRVDGEAAGLGGELLEPAGDHVPVEFGLLAAPAGAIGVRLGFEPQ
jgi:hypothetical protein